MNATPTDLPGVLILEPQVYRDDRGHFFESFNRKAVAPAGITQEFVQDNQSRSQKNVLRGLHAQLTQAQGKLVRVLAGEVFDVVVDIRRGSPTFKKWIGVTLSSDNFKQLYIPPGFAHGFCVLSAMADVLYKVTDFYAPSDELHLLWNDPDLKIVWPIQNPIVSPKDAAGVTLAEITSKLPVFRR
jgi:dTDP-4-dehydrorhamnose 3,5-epimerase